MGKFSTRIAAGIIIVVSIATAYFLYQYYLSSTFVSQVMPIYQKLDSLAQAQEKALTLPTTAETLAECQRINMGLRDIRGELMQIQNAEGRSAKLLDVFNNSLDKLMAWNVAATDSVLAEAKAQSSSPGTVEAAKKLAAEKKELCTTSATEYKEIIRTQLSRMLGLRR